MPQDPSPISWINNPLFAWPVALVLGVIGSVIANAIYPKLISFLEGPKNISRAYKGIQAKRLYELINDIHSGRKDRYEIILRLHITLAVAVVADFVVIAGGIVIAALAPNVDSTSPTNIVARPVAFFSFMYPVAIVLLILVLLFKRRLDFVVDSLADFDAYTASYEEEWGTSSPP